MFFLYDKGNWVELGGVQGKSGIEERNGLLVTTILVLFRKWEIDMKSSKILLSSWRVFLFLPCLASS
jgi:hypothetical protein